MSNWTTLSENAVSLASQSLKSWFRKWWKWLKETWSGKLTGCFLACFFARPMVDYMIRKIRGYPKGTIGLIPLISTIRMINPDDTEFVMKQPQIGAYSMHYSGFSPIVLINTRESARFVYEQAKITTRDFQMTREQRDEYEKIFYPLMGPLSFVSIDEESDWSKRRDLLVRNKPSDKLITRKIEEYFNDELVPTIDDGKVWMHQRQEITRMTFNIIFHVAFGSSLKISSKEMNEFIQHVLDSFDVVQSVIAGRSIPVPWLGVKLAQFLCGSQKKNAFRSFKETIGSWMKNYKHTTSIIPHYSHFANHVILATQNWLNERHGIADLSVLFFAGTQSTSMNIEQSLMHCARNPRLQDMMFKQLRMEFKDPSSILSASEISKRCPMIRAFVWETLRLNESTRFSVARTLNHDLCTDDGCTILPNHSVLLLNIYAINRDCSEHGFGEDAMEFNPARWIVLMDDDTLDDNNDYHNNNAIKLNFRMRNDKLATFGFGLRDCPGFDIAENEMVLILAHFLWRYRIEDPNESNGKGKLPLLKESDFNQRTSQLPLRYIKRV